MKGFPESFLEELKSRCRIENIISRYLTLEKKGRNFWGRCPFHLEKTPSFCVNEVDQFYHCFGCKAGGNVIKFIMEIESISFYDAVKMLADMCGLPLPVVDVDEAEVKRQKAERETMLACMKECAVHYHDNLKKSARAREYLNNRKISQEMINKFGIGCSLSYTEIIEHLSSKGFTKEIMKKVGIIKDGERGHYDAIGERIAFPVIDIYGNVVAFSGRTMEKKVDYAKYINTQETPLFSKSKNLFGINLVKKHKQTQGLKEIIIVEGQIDVIALHQAGYGNVVASLGTALTSDQARIMKRLCDNVIICYDGDFAGTKATLRGLDILKQESINVRVASLPDGHDPDEIIKEKGKEFFNKIIDEALPLIEFKLKYLRSQYNLNEFDGKAKYVDEAIRVLQGLSDTEAEVYLEYIKGVTGVNKDFLRNKLRNSNLTLASGHLINPMQGYKRQEKKLEMIDESEECVLAHLLRRKPYTENKSINEDMFSSTGRLFFNYLQDKSKTVQDFLNDFSGYSDDIGGIVNFDFDADEDINQQQFKDCLWRLYEVKLTVKQNDLTEQLKNASGEERRTIMQELMKISQQKNKRSID